MPAHPSGISTSTSTYWILFLCPLSNLCVINHLFTDVWHKWKPRLAYAHKIGVVLVDITQKCLIMNSTLADLYGTSPKTSVHGSANDRDIGIQPYATNSILQQHYQSQANHGDSALRTNYPASINSQPSSDTNDDTSLTTTSRKALEVGILDSQANQISSSSVNPDHSLVSNHTSWQTLNFCYGTLFPYFICDISF